MTLDRSGNTLGYAPVVPQAQSAGLRLAVLFLPLLLAGGLLLLEIAYARSLANPPTSFPPFARKLARAQFALLFVSMLNVFLAPWHLKSFRSYETGKAWLRALCIACCAALWLVLNISMAVVVAAVNSF